MFPSSFISCTLSRLNLMLTINYTTQCLSQQFGKSTCSCWKVLSCLFWCSDLLWWLHSCTLTTNWSQWTISHGRLLSIVLYTQSLMTSLSSWLIYHGCKECSPLGMVLFLPILDVIFVFYLVQRRIYRVDKNRLALSTGSVDLSKVKK